MGRHPRQPSETGYYHVVTRGNQRQTIFRQVDDYVNYCDLARAAYGENRTGYERDR
mgnify:CR=1 FL=1